MAAAREQALPDHIATGMVAKIAADLPEDWRHGVAREWRREFNRLGGYHFGANQRARDLVKELSGGELPLNADEDAVRRRAETNARSFRLMALAGWQPTEEQRIEMGAETIRSAIARAQDPQWWRRRLRKAHGRAVEAAGIKLGLVRSTRQPYCTDETLHRRRQQKQRNRATLEAFQAVNETSGDVLDLYEIVEASISNPAVRRCELMARMAGTEWYANTLGYEGWFLTFTTPSAYHPTRSVGSGRVVDNPNYAGHTPRNAQAWLTDMWARLRAAVVREGIDWFGIRVAEPHADGCPHWHLLIFVAPDQVHRMLELCRHYALQDRGDEPGAAAHRFKAKRIDRNKGSATGYIAKYIAKNIDGHGMDATDTAAGNELPGEAPESLAERVDAWASTWGIRQFQAIGSPHVSVWRELRRIEGEEVGVLELARAAAEHGHWGTFMLLMRRECHPVRTLTLQDCHPDTGELPTNRYGEPAAARIVGVECNGAVIMTRDAWRLERKPTADSSTESAGSQAPSPRPHGNGQTGLFANRPSAPLGTQPAGPSYLIRATLTEAGEAASGLPAGTLLFWPAAKRLPTGSDEIRIATWELLFPLSAVPPWRSVNNCTSYVAPCMRLPFCDKPNRPDLGRSAQWREGAKPDYRKGDTPTR